MKNKKKKDDEVGGVVEKDNQKKKKKEEREEKTQEVPHVHLLEQMLRTSSNCFLHHREKKNLCSRLRRSEPRPIA